MFRGKFTYGLVLVTLAVAVSVILLRPGLHGVFTGTFRMGCFSKGSMDSAYQADLRFLSQLGNGREWLHLTDGGETASEILSKLGQFKSLVVVTAGRGKLTRRAEDQPFISMTSASDLDSVEQHQGRQQKHQQVPWAQQGQQQDWQQQDQQQHEDEEQEQEPQQQRSLKGYSELDDADIVRRESTKTSPEYDSSGLAALAGAVGLMNTASLGLERVLGRRLFPITIAFFNRTAGVPYAIFDVSAGELLLDRQFVSHTWSEQGDNSPQVPYIAGQLANRVFAQMAVTLQRALPSFSFSPSSSSAAAGASGSTEEGGAAAATLVARIVSAAAAIAVPAVFTAMPPPLWFCILCPSVLGLLAPLLINLALNQVAGLLCEQLHLSDDACFDLMLGALGAGFVLSLASAVPIFFLCRLPQCAGRNATATAATVTATAAAVQRRLAAAATAAAAAAWQRH